MPAVHAPRVHQHRQQLVRVVHVAVGGRGQVLAVATVQVNRVVELVAVVDLCGHTRSRSGRAGPAYQTRALRAVTQLAATPAQTWAAVCMRIGCRAERAAGSVPTTRAACPC